jgi:predicted AAA+ superfamily ATPase
MGLRSFSTRLGRVLSLTERLLREVTGTGADARSFERHHAFRWEAERAPGRLVPIEAPAAFSLDDLIGVDRPLARFVANTEQFLHGLPANNVLLYGERGTGKSSAVRGVLERYAARGLRLIEVQRESLVHLPRILSAIRRDAARHRFLIFCDDLSFGTGESGYRELKAALDGSLEAPPSNVCLVATSNRRHLLPESMADNRNAELDESGELHLGEALEERLALSDRFGLVIGFYNFDQPTYLAIVEHYLGKAGFDSADFEVTRSSDDSGRGAASGVRAEALRWALSRASRSGRTARQFVDDYVGRVGLRSADSQAMDQKAE